MKVCKIFRFDAAHFLPNYDGKCKNMHGHGWVLEVEVEGPVYASGMVIDFAMLKSVVNKNVIEHLDHQLLNDIIDLPTCENILLWVAERLLLGSPSHLCRLRLYETPDSFAEEVYNAE